MSKVKKNANSSEEFSSSSCTSSSLSSDEEIDIRDLKPIKDYLSNRRELACQLFKSVKPEKIRMMLPQTMKKIDLGELEEWCSSELSGMSKTRILSILNGKPMLESSNTSESDDSGPSLEIISDTEEWFSDDDASKKDDTSSSSKVKIKKEKTKSKIKPHTVKKADPDKAKLRSKVNYKDGSDDKHRDVKVKTEGEKESNKEKEGDSLLDLLELEMRARAIRALIRNEEDIIPSANSKLIANINITNESNTNKSSQEELKEKENCRRQLEKIISGKQGSVDDEDVVLVVQPTPTIELLSSDSDDEAHGGARINQKLENERVLDTEKTEDRGKKGSSKNEELQNDLNASVTVTNRTTDSEATVRTPSKQGSKMEKRKKIKRTSHSKDSKETPEETTSALEPESSDHRVKSAQKIETANSGDATNETIEKARAEEDNNDTRDQKTASKSEEEKPGDLEEIIDLDDYCDDMEDMENCDSDKDGNKSALNKRESEKTKEQTKSSSQPANSAETWASRYYQTDDVQNVIKESKIQSEIRKRLRERQRLSKLSKSPNLISSSSSPATEAIGEKMEQKTTGSVGEYLALKRTASTSLSSSSNPAVSQEKNPMVDASNAANTEGTSGECLELQRAEVEKQSGGDEGANHSASPIARELETKVDTSGGLHMDQ
ncbi:hypothetical protein KM043_003631 [Ampulex compressa]|nr:hypothetical protein KM043_003631 [Ampulex compressa]